MGEDGFVIVDFIIASLSKQSVKFTFSMFEVRSVFRNRVYYEYYCS